MVTFWTIFQSIGSFVGILMTLIAFWGIISKYPKELFAKKLGKIVHEESKNANKDIEDNLQTVLKRLDANDQATVVSLRHSITDIYEKYKKDEKFPTHVKQDLLSLYTQYEVFGGNSYVHDIVDEMKDWKTE